MAGLLRLRRGSAYRIDACPAGQRSHGTRPSIFDKLATKGGVDPNLMLEILDNSAAQSKLIDYKAPFVLERDSTTNSSVKCMNKDIGLVLESGQELGVPLLLTGLTRQLFQTAIATGHGEEDIYPTIKVLEDLAGVEVVLQK